MTKHLRLTPHLKAGFHTVKLVLPYYIIQEFKLNLTYSYYGIFQELKLILIWPYFFQEFEPTIEMMMNDFDDERTMEEEEALGADDDDEADELSALEQEQVS